MAYNPNSNAANGPPPPYAYVPVDPFKPSLAFSLNNILPPRLRRGGEKAAGPSSSHHPPRPHGPMNGPPQRRPVRRYMHHGSPQAAPWPPGAYPYPYDYEATPDFPPRFRPMPPSQDQRRMGVGPLTQDGGLSPQSNDPNSSDRFAYLIGDATASPAAGPAAWPTSVSYPEFQRLPYVPMPPPPINAMPSAVVVPYSPRHSPVSPPHFATSPRHSPVLPDQGPPAIVQPRPQSLRPVVIQPPSQDPRRHDANVYPQTQPSSLPQQAPIVVPGDFEDEEDPYPDNQSSLQQHSEPSDLDQGEAQASWYRPSRSGPRPQPVMIQGLQDPPQPDANVGSGTQASSLPRQPHILQPPALRPAWRKVNRRPRSSRYCLSGYSSSPPPPPQSPGRSSDRKQALDSDGPVTTSAPASLRSPTPLLSGLPHISDKHAYQSPSISKQTPSIARPPDSDTHSLKFQPPNSAQQPNGDTDANTLPIPSTLAYILAFFFDTVPRQIYLYMLLRLPYLYFSRVTRIFEEAEMSMPMIKQGILDAARAKAEAGYDTGLEGGYAEDGRRKDGVGWGTVGQPYTYTPWAYMEPQAESVAYTNLQETWHAFIDSLLDEWRTLNIISVLLLSAILTILQIDSAASDPLTRYSALLSMICALMSLLYGCIYIIRFGTMRKTYKGAEWAEKAQQSRTAIWWNIWVLLAMPATWLAWSMILYIITIMAFVWRTSPSSQPSILTETSTQILIPRIVISLVLTVGVVYFILIATTLRTYGEMMDRAWQRRIWGWMRDGIGEVGGGEGDDVENGRTYVVERAVQEEKVGGARNIPYETASQYNAYKQPYTNGPEDGFGYGKDQQTPDLGFEHFPILMRASTPGQGKQSPRSSSQEVVPNDEFGRSKAQANRKSITESADKIRFEGENRETSQWTLLSLDEPSSSKPNSLAVNRRSQIKMVKLFGLSPTDPFADSLSEQDLTGCGLSLKELVGAGEGNAEWDTFKKEIRTAFLRSTSTSAPTENPHSSLSPILDKFNVALRSRGIEGQVTLCKECGEPGEPGFEYAIYYFVSNSSTSTNPTNPHEIDVTVKRYATIPGELRRLDVFCFIPAALPGNLDRAMDISTSLNTNADTNQSRILETLAKDSAQGL